MARLDIVKYFVSGAALRGTVPDFLHALCDLLVPRFLCAFIRWAVEADEKLVRKFGAFARGKRQGILRQLVDGCCHGVIFASTSYGSSCEAQSRKCDGRRRRYRSDLCLFV